MRFDKRHINTFLSLSIIGIWAVLIFLFAYPSRSAPAAGFGVVIFCIVTLFFGLGTGVIVLAIRAFKRNLKNTATFLYNFLGTLNFCLGVFGLTLTAVSELDRPWVILFSISFLVGVFILTDIYFVKDSKTI